MQTWMISANIRKYDHAGAFAQWGYLDWRQNGKYDIGDEVYIYCSSPIKKVMYKTIVTKIDIPFEKCSYDQKFVKDPADQAPAHERTYARLQLISKVDKEELALDYLKEHGLKAAPQRPIKVNTELRTYLEDCFG